MKISTLLAALLLLLSACSKSPSPGEPETAKPIASAKAPAAKPVDAADPGDNSGDVDTGDADMDDAPGDDGDDADEDGLDEADDDVDLE